MKITAGAQIKPDVHCHHGQTGAGTALSEALGQSKIEIFSPASVHSHHFSSGLKDHVQEPNLSPYITQYC